MRQRQSKIFLSNYYYYFSVGSSTDAIDYAKDFLRRQSTLENLLSAKSPDDCDDANSIWSILTDKLLYCQSDTSDSVRHFSYDSLKADSAKQRFILQGIHSIPYLVFDIGNCQNHSRV